MALVDDLAAILQERFLNLHRNEETIDPRRPHRREQLRRSLPVLEYFRSACEVESGTGVSRTLSVGYVLVFARGGARALDKQTLQPVPSKAEPYKNITVNAFIGTAIPFPSLMATLPAAHSA